VPLLPLVVELVAWPDEVVPLPPLLDDAPLAHAQRATVEVSNRQKERSRLRILMRALSATPGPMAT
jgi:hypothetical protein